MDFVYLQSIDSFFSGMFIRSSILFKYKNDEKLNLNRFLKAMEQTLDPFNLVLSTFKTDENGKIGIVYNPNQKKDLNSILEIENRENDSICDIDTNNLELILPKKLADKELMEGYSFNLNNKKVMCLKLTLLKDSFLIGYIVSHGIFDQSSIFYFFKYLSSCYTSGDGNSLKPPIFLNLTYLTNEDLKFKDLSDAITYHDCYLGFGQYVTFKDSNPTTIDNQLLENSIIQLKFNIEKLYEFKGNTLISKNDIITACLLKIFSFNPNLKKDEIFNFKYACNFRKFFNYDETAIGNYSVNKCVKISAKDLVDYNLIELALLNRRNVSNLKDSDFKNSLSWFNFFQNRNENCLNFSKDLNINSLVMSNWTSFEYNTIKFDSTTPSSLMVPDVYANFYLNFLSFEYDSNDNMFYNIKISVPSSCIPKVLELGEETSLFKVFQL